jgi:hypothetical protein
MVFASSGAESPGHHSPSVVAELTVFCSPRSRCLYPLWFHCNELRPTLNYSFHRIHTSLKGPALITEAAALSRWRSSLQVPRAVHGFAHAGGSGLRIGPNPGGTLHWFARFCVLPSDGPTRNGAAPRPRPPEADHAQPLKVEQIIAKRSTGLPLVRLGEHNSLALPSIL